MMEKSLSDYINQAKELDPNRPGKGLKLAFLSNFTINGLAEVIKVKCASLEISPKIYQAGYNQISQEILADNSELVKFRPNITFLLISPNYLFGQYEYEVLPNNKDAVSYIEERTDEFLKLADVFKSRGIGLLVLSNLKEQSHSILGITQDKFVITPKEMIYNFNKKLKDITLKNNEVYMYDFAKFFLKYGEYNIVNEKLNYLGDLFVSPDYLPALAEELMAYIKAYCSKNRKCIVLDLDNTLWGGIVGEDGFNGILLDNKAPGSAFFDFQKYLLALNKRGIVLAINSHNNRDEAMKVIKEHPNMVLREKNFASIQINWNDKINNMKEIAKELNIGTDSLVFFDDDLVNRELIRKAMPEVLVIDLPEDPSLYLRTIQEVADFDVLQITDEDFNKTEMYSQQKERDTLKSEFDNIEDFLRGLKMQIEIKRANEFTIPRIAQLVKKTNQFNLTTRRYEEEDIKKMCSSPEYLVYSVGVRDKIGDNGLTGVFILKKTSDVFVIDTFLLSCRIIGRNVEKVILQFICELALRERAKEVVGEYIMTEKNEPCRRMYEDNGFIRENENLFKLQEFTKIKKIDYIAVDSN